MMTPKQYKNMITKASKRRDRMLALRAKGLTLSEIASKYGCTKQNVHRILGTGAQA